MSDVADAERPQPDRVRLGSAQALYLYGVVRARSWRGGRANRVHGEDVIRIRYRDLEALVRPALYELPTLDEDQVMAHQRVVESALRRGTVLPFPCGVVFRGRRQLIRLLQEQYLVLDEALAFLDGYWELRLHIAANVAEEGSDLSDLAMQCYADLRRNARAAVPIPHETENRRLLTAAFLVERATWIDFVQRAEELGASHAELTFDVTGPWAPYDFVRVSV